MSSRVLRCWRPSRNMKRISGRSLARRLESQPRFVPCGLHTQLASVVLSVSLCPGLRAVCEGALWREDVMAHHFASPCLGIYLCREARHIQGNSDRLTQERSRPSTQSCCFVFTNQVTIFSRSLSSSSLHPSPLISCLLLCRAFFSAFCIFLFIHNYKRTIG